MTMSPTLPTAAKALPIGHVADLVRSKNAGPFWQTLDVFLDDDASYDAVAQAPALDPAVIGPLYRVDPDTVRIFRPDGTLVGFLNAGPCKLPLPEPQPGAGEIRQLYLRSSVQRGGLGTRLLVLGLEWLAAQGHFPLSVGVWSGNSGAQRLYGRFGFEKIGEYDFPVGKHLDREFILRRQTAA